MTPTNTKRASICTLGCRLNQAETALLEEQLRRGGYALVPFGERAELGIIHTCTVTGTADAKSRQMVRQFIRKNPGAYTAVIGCYAQMGYKALADIAGVDLIVGNQEKLNVLNYVTPEKRAEPLVVRDRIVRDDFTVEVVTGGELTRRANLKVQDGCDFMCTFCIIPFARGRARSREMENLLDEARALVRGGAKEIVLTGVNLGTYASGGSDIVDVVDRVAEATAVARVRISSIEPTTIPWGLIERMADPAHPLTPFLHIPLQSGSDRVLEGMRRKYSAAEFVAFIRDAAARVPGLCIGTDVMTGFPGETGEDFEATCQTLAQEPVAYAHVFKYSERAGAAAARFAGKLEPDVLNRRSAAVRQISDRKRRAFHEQHLGRTMPVLFEHEVDGLWTGYTENYIRVAVGADRPLENRILPVRLEACRSDLVKGVLDDDAWHGSGGCAA